MKVIRASAELRGTHRPICAAMGFFDGVHLGHQHVIRQAVLDARAWDGLALAITFDPHPLRVVGPDRAPLLLQTVDQRLRAIAEIGIATALVVPFTEELSRVPGDAFIRGVALDAGTLRSISVGEGFTFGHRRSGDTSVLERVGRELGFKTHALAPIAIGGETVSSTRIRQALREGQLELVAELLGRPYAVGGVVMRGNALGRQLGYPTANIDIAGLELPPPGVYAAWTHIDGKTYAAAVNLGRRPTLRSPTPELCFEAHLLDFEGDLYGQPLEIELRELLRGEKRFESLDALRAQIGVDVARVRELTRAI